MSYRHQAVRAEAKTKFGVQGPRSLAARTSDHKVPDDGWL